MTEYTEFHSSVRGLVATLRRLDGTYPAWRMPFELARTLRRFEVPNPVVFEPACDLFCREMGLDPFDGWVRFLACWPLVRCPAGGDAWEAAVSASRSAPLATDPDPGPKLRPLASVVAYLAHRAGGDPFPFPVPRVAASFGWPKVTASRAVRSLVTAGVVAFADPTWSYTDGRARTCRLVARIVRGTSP